MKGVCGVSFTEPVRVLAIAVAPAYLAGGFSGVVRVDYVGFRFERSPLGLHPHAERLSVAYENESALRGILRDLARAGVGPTSDPLL